MLAYVFWHWKQDHVAEGDYRARQRAFHAVLASARPPGFVQSFSFRYSHAPWANDGNDAYEDWYVVEDFEALGKLNEGAVAAERRAPHDAAAANVAGGAGGVYALRAGAALPRATIAYWFAKPRDMSYAQLFAQLEPLAATPGTGLWMRQMVLGPALEFCMHATRPLSLPAPIHARIICLSSAW